MPAAKLLRSSVVAPVLQAYVYVPLPPVAVKSIAPVEEPLQTTLVTEVDNEILQEPVLKVV